MGAYPRRFYMAISMLQVQAFVTSRDFTQQVESIVTREALYRADTWEGMDTHTRMQLSNVAKSPQAYGFTSCVVQDAGWTMTYDTWADDPPEAEGAIAAAIAKHWLLLTGIEQPVVEEEAE